MGHLSCILVIAEILGDYESKLTAGFSHTYTRGTNTAMTVHADYGQHATVTSGEQLCMISFSSAHCVCFQPSEGHIGSGGGSDGSDIRLYTAACFCHIIERNAMLCIICIDCAHCCHHAIHHWSSLPEHSFAFLVGKAEKLNMWHAGALVHHTIGWWDVKMAEAYLGCSEYRIGESHIDSACVQAVARNSGWSLLCCRHHLPS